MLSHILQKSINSWISVLCALIQLNTRHAQSHPTEVDITPATSLPQRSHTYSRNTVHVNSMYMGKGSAYAGYIPLPVVTHTSSINTCIRHYMDGLRMPATSLPQWSHTRLQYILVYVITWMVCICRLHPSPSGHTHVFNIYLYTSLHGWSVCAGYIPAPVVTQTSFFQIHLYT